MTGGVRLSRVGFSTARVKNIYVPSRSSRVEGEFPPMRSRGLSRGIVDIDSVDASVGSEQPSRSVKPHLLNRRDKDRSHTALNDEARPNMSLHELRSRGGSPDASSVKSFDASADLPRGTSKADLLKLKKFRWMPNPFLPNNDLRQGGPLFYAKHFADRDRRLDEKGVKEELRKQADLSSSSSRDQGDVDGEDKVVRRKKAVWKGYRQISESEISRIPSIDKLSKHLVNEVFLVKESGMTDPSSARISLFETRLLELLADAAPASTELSPQTVRSTIAIVKAIYQFGVLQRMDPNVLNRGLEVIVSRLRYLKPEHLVYLLESLSRLRFRDQRCLQVIDALSLCWPAVGRNPVLLIKGANAMARLDLVSKQAMAGIRPVLAEALPRLTKSQLSRIKAVTVCNLFDEVMVLDYLVLCHRANLDYARHALVAFVSLRASNPAILSKIPSSTKEWLESVVAKLTSTPHMEGDDVSQWSSTLHQDIALALSTIDPAPLFSTSTRLGPFGIDIFIPACNSVIDACSEYQFYTRTAKFTSEARLRHSLIRSLGFKVVPVPFFQWSALKDEKSKMEFIRTTILANST